MQNTTNSQATTKNEQEFKAHLQKIYLEATQQLIDDEPTWYKTVIDNSRLLDYHEDISDCLHDVFYHLTKDNQHLATGHSVDSLSANFILVIEFLREIRKHQQSKQEAQIIVSALKPMMNEKTNV